MIVSSSHRCRRSRRTSTLRTRRARATTAATTSRTAIRSGLAHLRRDWARPSHICTGLTPAHICAGTGLAPPTSALGSPHRATSAPGPTEPERPLPSGRAAGAADRPTDTSVSLSVLRRRRERAPQGTRACLGKRRPFELGGSARSPSCGRHGNAVRAEVNRPTAYQMAPTGFSALRSEQTQRTVGRMDRERFPSGFLRISRRYAMRTMAAVRTQRSAAKRYRCVKHYRL